MKVVTEAELRSFLLCRSCSHKQERALYRSVLSGHHQQRTSRGTIFPFCSSFSFSFSFSRFHYLRFPFLSLSPPPFFALLFSTTLRMQLNIDRYKRNSESGSREAEVLLLTNGPRMDLLDKAKMVHSRHEVLLDANVKELVDIRRRARPVVGLVDHQNEIVAEFSAKPERRREKDKRKRKKKKKRTERNRKKKHRIMK